MATVATGTKSAFLQTLLSEAEAVQQFVDLLKLEQSALSTGNTDDLPSYTDKKMVLAANLNRLAVERNAFLATQGLGANLVGIGAWFANHPKEHQANNTWSSVLALAREARELNRLNGELIQIRMQYNAKALEALKGGNHTLNLYGPDGQSTTSNQNRIDDAV